MGTVHADLILRNARELLTMPPDAGPARSTPKDVGRIERGALACREGRIVWVGPEDDLPSAVEISSETRELDASGCVVMPGLVDPHTHLVFGGGRAHEFHLRNAGASYQEIGAAGGGILSTVESTRAADAETLTRAARERIGRFLAKGVTTLEVKSGYGLDSATERKILEVVKRLAASEPISLIPTFLGAHTVPKEFKGRRGDYLDLVCEQMIPELAAAKLAEFVDVFCEEGAFSLEESRRVLEAGRQHGLAARIHAEQFSSSGGARLAVELGAASCDHLEEVDAGGMAALAAGNTTATLLPGVSVFLGLKKFAPARQLLDAGVRVALGTDCNPGTCHSENLWLMTTLACSYMAMTAEEVLAGVTTEAARSLLRHDRVGSLLPGYDADVVMVEAPSYSWIPYHMGGDDVALVIQAGQPLAR